MLAKVIATYGPALEGIDFKQLKEAGASVVRINFSHVNASQTEELVNKIKEAGLRVLGDIRGPKLRIGQVEDAFLEEGKLIKLREDLKFDLNGDFKENDKVILGDNEVELKVESVEANEVILKVVLPGKIRARMGINFPDSHIEVTFLSEKDIDDIRYAVKFNYDFLAVSFVGTADDVNTVKQLVNGFGGKQFVIAKIERKKALKHLDSIIAVSDGVMVARGDLGVEITEAKVPWAQKNILRKVRRANKFSIVATQLLETMIQNPVPSRAEVSDVANAILDGADALLLTQETAIGNYPLRAVSTLKEVSKHAVKWMDDKIDVNNIESFSVKLANSKKHSVAIFVLTKTGKTALKIASKRPKWPVVFITPEERTMALANIVWGGMPLWHEWCYSLDKLNDFIKEQMKKMNIKEGIILAGFPVGKTSDINLLHTIKID